MRQAYAPGTFKNLHCQWELYFMFCEYFNLQDLPTCTQTLCLYARFLSRSFKSTQSIQNYLSGVKTLHVMLDLDFSNENIYQLKLLLRGIARKKLHVPTKAEPVSPTILRDIYPHLRLSHTFDCAWWSAILLMFFLMARKSNLFPNSLKDFDADKQLLRRDISLKDNLLIVNIKWSKTRQFGHSRDILVCSIPTSCLCPVSAYKNMLSLIPAKDTDPAFCFKSKSGLVPISYAKFQNKLRKTISKTGRDGNAYSSHGIRRGSCSFAFKSQIPSELIQSHGDWLSDAYKEYLQYDFQQKLSVSKQMCINIQNSLL